MSSNNNQVMPSLSATASSAKTSSSAAKTSSKKSAKSSKKSTKSSKSKSSKITLKRGAGLRGGRPLAPLPSPQGVSVKQLTYTKQMPGLSTSMPVESNSSATWNPQQRNYELVAPDKKNSYGKSVNMSNASSQKYNAGIGGAAKTNTARLENETQFAQQFSIALDQLRGCKHGNVIEDVHNSFYISDLPALMACMTKANLKTGKLESYSQRSFFILFFGAGFKLVKDPRRYRGDSVKKGDVLTGYHPDETAFLPGNAPSIAKVVVKKHVPQTNDGVKLSGGKGALAPDSDAYQLPSSCVNGKKEVKNFTSEEKENVISHMMTLNEDKLEEFLDNRLTLDVKRHLLSHLGLKTRKNSAECKVMIVDAIKKRNEEELDEKPAAKPDI